MLLLFVLGIAVAVVVGGGVGRSTYLVLGPAGMSAKYSSSANTPEKRISPGLEGLLKGSRLRKSSKKGLGRLETRGRGSLVPP